MTTTVRTQAELDAALKVGGEIVIDSPPGVTLELRNTDSATVYAYGSATVYAYGSATVYAYGSATVYAYGSATVYAYDSATVYAYDSATVRAAKYVAVHLFSQRVTLRGGVLIDMTAVDGTNLEDWTALTGATIADGKVTLYKAVDNDLNSGRGFAYPIGKTVTCEDFNDRPECGGGLHLSPTPWLARDYFTSAARYLECRVKVADLVLIDRTKVKARRVKVVREVDLHMRPVRGVKP